jgi:hypothetical protein
MLGEDFEICRFGVEPDLCVGPVAEAFVAGAAASAQGSEHLPIKVDEVWTVFSSRLISTVCMVKDDSMDSI